MSSLISNFEYDIFISYRHNDNRSGWVTEFVKALQEELAATIKDSVSVYFDTNPHDGLLETHNVDKSLEGKLKCLIFIPIISQTYCDTKSFAWQQEFCAFNKLAKVDQFGRDIKLSNGNVASRILPIKIHDLDAADKVLLENELGGALRAIEFIFRSPGVNRPLSTHEDHPQDNLNKTFYRDQVNKVANAIKDIVSTLKNPVVQMQSKVITQYLTSEETRRKRYPIAVVFSIVLIVGGYFLYPRLFPINGEIEDLDKSIAVLPFDDMSPNHDQEYFSDGLSEELLNVLAKVPDLKVIARTSSFAYKGKKKDIRMIGQELNVSHILEGSVRKSNNTIRISAQLIKASDGTHLFSETYDREVKDIFKIQDEIAAAVVNSLKLKLLNDSNGPKYNTISPEAYKFYLLGNYHQNRVEYAKAGQAFEAALQIDSLYAKAWVGKAWSFFGMNDSTSSQRRMENLREVIQHALNIDPNEVEAISAMAYIHYAADLKFEQASEEIRRCLESDPNNLQVLISSSILNAMIGKIHDAEMISRKMIELDPINAEAHTGLGIWLQFQNKLTEAEKELNMAHELAPKNTGILNDMGWISLQKGNPLEALERLVNKSTENCDVCRISSSMVYFALGRKKESDEILKWAESKEATMAPIIAMCYAYRNDKDQAFKWMERALDQKQYLDLLLGKEYFFFDKLRADSRYKKILKRLNLPM